MEISYEIRKYDYWNFIKYSMFHSTSTRNMNIVIFLIMAFIFGQRIMKNPSPILQDNISRFLFDLIVFGLLYYLLLWISYMVKSSNHLGSQTVTLSEDGIKESTPLNKGFYKWQGIRNIKSNNLYIFIFITDSMGIIIPKRAFPSVVEADNFLYTAHAFYNKSRVVS